MTAVDIWDSDNFIGSENGFNIFTVARNSGAINPEERAKLDVTGEFHFGEFINAFRHGKIPTFHQPTFHRPLDQFLC